MSNLEFAAHDYVAVAEELYRVRGEVANLIQRENELVVRLGDAHNFLVNAAREARSS
jgi:hypothetical protein